MEQNPSPWRLPIVPLQPHPIDLRRALVDFCVSLYDCANANMGGRGVGGRLIRLSAVLGPRGKKVSRAAADGRLALRILEEEAFEAFRFFNLTLVNRTVLSRLLPALDPAVSLQRLARPEQRRPAWRAIRQASHVVGQLSLVILEAKKVRQIAHRPVAYHDDLCRILHGIADRALTC